MIPYFVRCLDLNDASRQIHCRASSQNFLAPQTSQKTRILGKVAALQRFGPSISNKNFQMVFTTSNTQDLAKKSERLSETTATSMSLFLPWAVSTRSTAVLVQVFCHCGPGARLSRRPGDAPFRLISQRESSKKKTRRRRRKSKLCPTVLSTVLTNLTRIG